MSGEMSKGVAAMLAGSYINARNRICDRYLDVCNDIKYFQKMTRGRPLMRQAITRVLVSLRNERSRLLTLMGNGGTE